MTELEQLLENLSLQDENEDSIQTANNSNSISLASVMEFKTEYLNCVPTFSGNPGELNEFIASADSIVNTFCDRQNPNNFLNTYIFRSIQNKLVGNAKIAVNTQTCTTWEDLKLALSRNFSDQRDEVCLIRDLVLTKQNNLTPLQYYEKCIHLLNLLCSYVDSHETLATSKETKRTLYNNLTLKTFLAGLKEPLGSSVRAMRPGTLQIALQYINEENNIRYCQKDVSTKNFNPSVPIGNNRSSFPSQPIKYETRPVQRNYPTNSQVFKKPPQPQNKNVFRPNPNYRPDYKPTPMSVSTGRTFAPRTAQNNQNFMSEELFNAETIQDEPDVCPPISSSNNQYFHDEAINPKNLETFDEENLIQNENFYEANIPTETT